MRKAYRNLQSTEMLHLVLPCELRKWRCDTINMSFEVDVDNYEGESEGEERARQKGANWTGNASLPRTMSSDIAACVHVLPALFRTIQIVSR